MGSKSRRKGISGELEVCKLLRRWFPNTKRSFGQARYGGSECPDIVGGVEEHFYVEVKRYRKLSSIQIRGFWEKAKQDRSVYNNKLRLMMIFREDREEWNVWFESKYYSDDNGALVNRRLWESFMYYMDENFNPSTQKGDSNILK